MNDEYCDACNNTIIDSGGVLHGSPDGYNRVNSYYLCRDCTDWLIDMIMQAGR